MPKKHNQPRIVCEKSLPLIPLGQWPPEVWAALHRAAQRLGQIKGSNRGQREGESD